MPLLKYLLLLSFIIYPQFLVTSDAEKGLPVSQSNIESAVNFTVLESKYVTAAKENNRGIIKQEKVKLQIVESKIAKPSIHAVKLAIPLPISHDSFNSLYDGFTHSDSSSFGKKLHELIESRHDDGTVMNREYSHYLIDRLVIESGTSLNYAEKQEEIKYLMESKEFSITENQMQNEVDFLMQTLATLPLGAESPPWREGWYSRLQQWPEINETDHMEANSNLKNEYNGWRTRVSDYQQVREQLVQQLGDKQDVFEVAQEDLRNSYFTNQEITLITITDNTIDLLKNTNR